MVLEIDRITELPIPRDILIREDIKKDREINVYKKVLDDIDSLPEGLGYKIHLAAYRRVGKPHYESDLKRGISHARFAVEMLELLEDEEIRDKMLKEREYGEAPKSVVLSAVANEIMKLHQKSNVLSEGEETSVKRPLLSLDVLKSVLDEEKKEASDNGKEILDKSQLQSLQAHNDVFEEGFNLVLRLVGSNQHLPSNKQSVIYADA